MKKSELKSGMLTLNRKGEYGLVMLNTEGGNVIASNGDATHDWGQLDQFKENLECVDDERTIVAVYGVSTNRYRASFDVAERRLLWKRPIDEIVNVPLNDKYTAEVNKTKKVVKVGCQTFEFGKIFDIVVAIEK